MEGAGNVLNTIICVLCCLGLSLAWASGPPQVVFPFFAAIATDNSTFIEPGAPRYTLNPKILRFSKKEATKT